MGALLMCSERVVRAVNVGRTYEQSYNSDSDAVKQLQKELVCLYGAALDVLADADNLFDKGTCARTMKAVLFPHESSNLLSILAAREATVDQVARTCGAEVDAQVVDMIRGPVTRIDLGVEALLQHEAEETVVKILDWISEVDYEAQHEAAKTERTADTCKWLLEKAKFSLWSNLSASSILCPEGSRERYSKINPESS